MGNSSSASSLPALQVAAKCDTASFMGTWFVIGVKPTVFEKTCSNAVEKYSFLTEKKNDIDIDFKYNNKDPISSPLKSLPQKGWVQGSNKNNSAEWTVSPFWPIKMPYLILEVDDEYSYTVIGYPSRDYCWIMSRKPVMPAKTYEMLKKKLVEKHQYNLDGLRDVPQVWTKEEREKRGLTKEEIPDSMLVSSDK
jgi:apolipoprotein D and lipocalin family protein